MQQNPRATEGRAASVAPSTDLARLRELADEARARAWHVVRATMAGNFTVGAIEALALRIVAMDLLAAVDAVALACDEPFTGEIAARIADRLLQDEARRPEGS